MNLGIVSYDYDPPIGGLGVIAKMYADRLKLLDPSMSITSISPSPNSDDYASLRAASRWNKAGGSPLFSLFFNAQLRHIVQKHSLDLLHLHAGSGGVFLVRRAPCPVVITSHHTSFQEAELLFHAHPIKRFWKYLLSFAERRTYHMADNILCVSKDTADVLVTRYKIPKEKVTVVENPVDPIFFNQDAPVLSTGSLLYIGRIEERKGVTYLLQAFSEVSVFFPQSKLTLIGSNLIGNRLYETLHELTIQDRVSVRGFLSQKERLAEMRRAGIIVVPSLLEGFGLVAAEAMSLGVPVLVSDCDGLRSLIRNGDTGVVFRNYSATSLREQLHYALSHPEQMRRMADRAFLEARERFDLEKQARALLNVLRESLRTANK